MNKMFLEVWNSIEPDLPIGVGTGRTVEAWLDYGYSNGFKLGPVVASSKRTAEKLAAMGYELTDLQSESSLALYVDSADEVSADGFCIKGGGGAMTMEKIVCSAAKEFICIAAIDKLKEVIGGFPVAIEVLPVARSFVGRALLAIGADPVYREGFVTDAGNIIIDAFGLDFSDLFALELNLDRLLGVVGHGLFVTHAADKVYVASENNYKLIEK